MHSLTSQTQLLLFEDYCVVLISVGFCFTFASDCTGAQRACCCTYAHRRCSVLFMDKSKHNLHAWKVHLYKVEKRISIEVYVVGEALACVKVL